MSKNEVNKQPAVWCHNEKSGCDTEATEFINHGLARCPKCGQQFKWNYTTKVWELA